MPDSIQLGQSRRKFENCSGNFLIIRFTARKWPLRLPSVLSVKNHLGDKRFAVDEEVVKEAKKWLRHHLKDFYVAGYDALVRKWDK
jgi:hypothetical protein